MIATIAVIAAIAEKKKTSAIVAIIWKPLSDHSDRSDYMEYGNHFPITAIVAIIWKPGFSLVLNVRVFATWKWSTLELTFSFPPPPPKKTCTVDKVLADRELKQQRRRLLENVT